MVIRRVGSAESYCRPTCWQHQFLTRAHLMHTQQSWRNSKKENVWTTKYGKPGKHQSHLASKSYTHLRYPSNLVGRKVSKTFTDQVAQTNLTRPGQDGGPRLGPQDHSPSRSCRPVNHMGVESCFPIDAGGEFSTPANTHGPLSTRILRICPKSL